MYDDLPGSYRQSKQKRFDQELRKQEGEIEVYWLSTHKGAKGNGRTNQLAKEATLYTKTKAH